MAEHPIEALMKTTMESIKEMVDVNTIVGDAVESPDGSVIIPISKVCFGFASGGGEYTNLNLHKGKQDQSNLTKDGYPFAGGAGAGVSINPVAFLIVGNGQMKLMSLDLNASLVDNIINSTPKVIESIHTMFTKKSKGSNCGCKSDIVTFD